MLAKYTELLALRAAVGVLDAASARPRLRALAARFPGALRELDRAPLETLEARRDALLALVRDDSPERALPAWVRAQLAFHGALVALLEDRRRGQRGGGPLVPQALARAASAAELPVEAVRAALWGQPPSPPPEGFAAPDEDDP